MKIQIGFVFVHFLLCMNKSIQVNSLKNEYICDCLYNSTPSYSSDTITFICFDHWRLIDFFTPIFPPYFQCRSDTGWWNAGSMNFRDCQMTKINYNIFDAFERLYTLNVSSMELRVLPKEFFIGANYLKRLIASDNRLTKISESQFVHTPNLTEVDFSFNRIDYIDEKAFIGTDQLQAVNISHNHIITVHPKTFAYSSNLEALDLSFNDILKIENSTFIQLRVLEFLSLSNNNVTNIEPGAIVSQKHIKTIYLNDNNLNDLDGFKNLLFSNLQTITISRNRFNCSYLRAFKILFNYRGTLSGLNDCEQHHIATQTNREFELTPTRILSVTSDNQNHIHFSENNMQGLLMTSCVLAFMCILALVGIFLWTRKSFRDGNCVSNYNCNYKNDQGIEGIAPAVIENLYESIMGGDKELYTSKNDKNNRF